MRFYWLTVGMLCVWRATHLLYGEDGPWHVLAKLRQWVGKGFWASLLDCFYCLSLWVAVPFAWLLGETRTEKLLLWPALSGGAILLERITSHNKIVPVQYFEDAEQPKESL